MAPTCAASLAAWNAEDAEVLADHLEERGFDALASYLREGPSSFARSAVEIYLDAVTGTVSLRVHWQIDWLPGYTLTKDEWRRKVKVKVYGRDEARRLLRKTRQLEPVDAL
jgi:hypothetical protein